MRRLTLSLLAMLPGISRSQAVDVPTGAKVRITAPGLRLTGRVVSRTVDSIVVVTPASAEHRLALATVRGLSVSQGRSHLLGAERGFVRGAVYTLPLTILATMGYALTTDTHAGNPDGNPSPRRFALTMMGECGVIGALIGGAVGSEKWKSYVVSAARSMSTSLSVTPGNLGAEVRYRFR